MVSVGSNMIKLTVFHCLLELKSNEGDPFESVCCSMYEGSWKCPYPLNCEFHFQQINPTLYQSVQAAITKYPIQHTYILMYTYIQTLDTHKQHIHMYICHIHINNRYLYLIVQEAESLRLRCWQGSVSSAYSLLGLPLYGHLPGCVLMWQRALASFPLLTKTPAISE